MTTWFKWAAIAAIFGAAACSSSPSTHTVRGQVHGIWDGADGVGLQLQTQGKTELLTVPANGDFHFATELMPGASYVVTVLASPYLHDCVVTTGGNGVTGDDDVTDISIGCTGPEVSVEFSGGHGWTFDPTADSQSFDGTVFDEQVSLTVTGLILTGATLDLSPVQFGVAKPLSVLLGQTTATLHVTAPANLSRNFVFMFHRGQAPITQRTYAKPSITGKDFEFGSAMALDGDTLVVSAPQETVASTINGAAVPLIGAVYVFVRSGDSWTQQARLTPPVVTDGLPEFGRAVAVSGDTIAVGMPGDRSGSVGVGGDPADLGAFRSGAVVVFVRSGTTWTQQAYIKATNPGVQDSFGTAVALDGNLLAVGAPFEDSAAVGVNPVGGPLNDDAMNAGAVYTYRRTGATWAPEAYVKPSTSIHDDNFGTAVAVAGDTLAVGAPGEASAARGINGDQNDTTMPSAGAAYVFTHSLINGWSQDAYVKAVNTGANDQFGGGIAVSATTLAVTAEFEAGLGTGTTGDPQNRGVARTGAAYVYRRNGASWAPQAYLKANSTATVFFGNSLAMSGNLLAVGAAFEPNGATDPTTHQPVLSGAAYVFGLGSDQKWALGTHVVASNPDHGDEFGSAVALGPDMLAVGARAEASGVSGVGNGGQPDNSTPEAGALYVFR